LSWKKTGIFFRAGLDHPNQIELLQEIAVYAQRFFQGIMGWAKAHQASFGLRPLLTRLEQQPAAGIRARPSDCVS
jgi:hypothetical protein